MKKSGLQYVISKKENGQIFAKDQETQEEFEVVGIIAPVYVGDELDADLLDGKLINPYF